MIYQLALILKLVLAQEASAYLIAGSMGRDAKSSMGQCLTVTRPNLEEARVILREHRIRVSANAHEDEMTALARGIKQIAEIHGGPAPFEPIEGAAFIYRDSSSVWNQNSGAVHVNREWSTDTGMNPENIGMLMHELAHYVGNKKDSPANYRKYFAAVPEPCLFSWYSTKKRTEEFADVFATMVVNPANLLEFGGGACQKAYDFFKNNFFSKGKLAECPQLAPSKQGPTAAQKPRKWYEFLDNEPPTDKPRKDGEEEYTGPKLNQPY